MTVDRASPEYGPPPPMPSLARTIASHLSAFNAHYRILYWVLGVPLAVILHVLLLPFWLFLGGTAYRHEKRCEKYRQENPHDARARWEASDYSAGTQFWRVVFGPYLLLALFDASGRAVVEQEAHDLARELIHDWDEDEDEDEDEGGGDQ